MSEYLFMLPLEPMAPGDVYPSSASLPLHCTVVHWFHLGGMMEITLCNKVFALASGVGQKHLELVSKEPALFGPQEDVPCFVLERSEQLQLLHTEMLLALAETRCVFTELRWVGAGYRPHVTSKDQKVFAAGSTYKAGSMVLIKRSHNLAVIDTFYFS